jgi:hypothetical protein
MNNLFNFITKYGKIIPMVLFAILVIFASISCLIIIGKKISIFIGTCGLIATLIVLG